MGAFNLGSVGSLLRNIPGVASLARTNPIIDRIVKGSSLAGGAAAGLAGLDTTGVTQMIGAGNFLGNQLGTNKLGTAILNGKQISVPYGSVAGVGGRIGSIPPTDKNGNTYRSEELRLSAKARADQIGRGGSGAGGSVSGGNMGGFVPPGAAPAPFANPAAERAYQSQMSSTAQQAMQNPELQRWEAQRQADVKSGNYQQSQDMGMAIWAKANPTLAAKVRPGQSGYGAIQNTFAGSAAGAGFQAPGQLVPTPQLSASTPFPGGAPGAPAIPPGFTPGMGAEGQLSALPAGFDPAAAKIGPFAEFIKNKLKK